MQSRNWTPAHCEALRQHRAKRLTYSEIAAAINAEFKTAYSRNATIGRAKRMGLGGSKRAENLPQLEPRAPQSSLRKIRRRRRRLLDTIWRVPTFERTEPAKLRYAEVEPRHLSLMQLAPGDCRYPYGGDEEGEAVTFCGLKRRRGSSYCSPHFHLSWGPGTASERDAVRIALQLVQAT